MSSLSQKQNQVSQLVRAEANQEFENFVRRFVDGFWWEKVNWHAKSPTRSALGGPQSIQKAKSFGETLSRIHVGAPVWLESRDRAQLCLPSVDSGLLVSVEVRLVFREHISVFRWKSFCGAKMA